MNRGKRLDIQALRAIAVLAVVIYHLWPDKLIGGFMGVDIFFVISGYLMTTTLLRDIEPVIAAKNKLKATGTFLANFYARRIKRLIPAASVTLLSTLGLVYATGNLSLIQETAKQITASALFVQNWYLANNSVDYLANTNPTALQHFWTLSLEEQFYFIWPLLLLVLLLLFSNLFIFYKTKRVTSLVVIPILLLIAGFFAYGYQLTNAQPALAYFVTPARVWELLLGGIVAFLPVLKSYDLRLILPWFGSALIGYSLYKWGGDGFPGWHALVPTIGTALIIYSGGMASESKWSFEQVLRHKPIQWLGNLSYSLYLWHWPLIVLLPVLFYVDIDTHPYSILIKFTILALSLIAAQLSYQFIEKTTQHATIRKRYTYGLFIITTILVAGLAYFVAHRVETTAQATMREIHSAVLTDDNICIGAKSIVNDCEKSFGYIKNEYEQIAAADKYDFVLSSKETCASYDAQRYRTGIRNICVVGDINAKREITVWGDSHAQHWINPMDKIGQENNIKVNIVGTSSCFGRGSSWENCEDRFKNIEESGVLDRSESIIISMWHSDKFKDTKGNNLINAIHQLNSLTDNRNIYVLEDTPISGKEGGPDCTIMRLSCKNRISAATDPIAKNSKDIVELGLITPDRIIPTKDMFCDNDYCYSVIGGINVYRDKNIGLSTDGFNSHLTASYAYSTWPILESKLREKGAL